MLYVKIELFFAKIFFAEYDLMLVRECVFRNGEYFELTNICFFGVSKIDVSKRVCFFFEYDKYMTYRKYTIYDKMENMIKLNIGIYTETVKLIKYSNMI